ncbi:hypothetical protein [Mycoplasmopsis alligatoris]|uniref:PTS EIIB type-1 domain-containing protein n=1 Tax=Mycoplasmopsis alligatoris A21JP2 TaxID=747682 RepID=D4XV10_9BACT|nr:hypothetical protein [Mycoplasmopsis alligatoris]EFF41835.1 conserved hypothetical protein [Mycoplasmopsis alligatoris A21JP2]
MKTSDKILMTFLTIITFGLIWIKWNKDKKHTKNTIYQLNKLPCDVEKLVENINLDNIVSIKKTSTRIIIQIKDSTLVNQQAIKDTKGVSGLFISSQSISIIFGEYTSAVYEELLKIKDK